MLFILPEFKDLYEESVNKGTKIAEDKTVAFVGLCRNVEERLEENVNKLNSLNLKTKSFYIYENDSKDKTPQILKKLSNSIDLNYTSEILDREQYGTVKSKDRVTRLAEYRNRCVEYSKKNFASKDYIVVIDLDFIDFSLSGFYHSLSCINSNQDIDAMAGFSYEIKTMDQHPFAWNYDCWAFRWHNWADTHFYKTKSQPMFNNMLWFGFWQPLIGSPPISVNSAFGGCCIYKTSKYLNGQYSGDDCEHVTFHKDLKNNNNKFQLYVNPSQIMFFS